MNDSRANPVAWLLLFASGVNRKLLRLVPIERTEFYVQGTGIFLASGLAFVATYLATAMLVAPAPGTSSRLVIAGLVSAVVFTFDRSLVRSNLNPYEFPPDVVQAIWDPSADAKWYDVLAGRLRTSSAGHRIKTFVVVLLKASIRFALAAFVAYIVADTVVIYMFKPTVDARARVILENEQKQALDDAKSTLAAASQKVVQERQALTHLEEGDPQVSQYASHITQLQTDITNLSHDIPIYRLWLDKEIEGGARYLPPLLADGTQLPRTTGKPGCSTVCMLDRPFLAADTEALGEKTRELASVRNHQKTAIAALGGKYASKQEDIAAEERNDQENYNEAITQARAMSTVPSDILIRRQALDQLVKDTNPDSIVATPQKACSPGAVWFCELQRSVFPTTPIGSYVSVFRAILFLVDTLPILLKVFSSLRVRRPYDALVAALEEAGVADAINWLDSSLNATGTDMERRAGVRRGQRRGTGAAFLRETRAAAKNALPRQLPEPRHKRYRSQFQADIDWLFGRIKRQKRAAHVDVPVQSTGPERTTVRVFHPREQEEAQQPSDDGSEGSEAAS